MNIIGEIQLKNSIENFMEIAGKFIKNQQENSVKKLIIKLVSKRHNFRKILEQIIHIMKRIKLKQVYGNFPSSIMKI